MHKNPRESEAQILTVTVGRVLQKATPHGNCEAWIYLDVPEHWLAVIMASCPNMVIFGQNVQSVTLKWVQTQMCDITLKMRKQI